MQKEASLGVRIPPKKRERKVSGGGDSWDRKPGKPWRRIWPFTDSVFSRWTACLSILWVASERGPQQTWLYCTPPPLSPPGECDCRSPISLISRLSAPQQPRLTAKVHLISSPPLGKPRQAEPRDQAPCRRGWQSRASPVWGGSERQSEWWEKGNKAAPLPSSLFISYILGSCKMPGTNPLADKLSLGVEKPP